MGMKGLESHPTGSNMLLGDALSTLSHFPLARQLARKCLSAALLTVAPHPLR